MKTLGLVLTALLLTGSAAAQTAAPAPERETHGVSVVKARWQKRFYNPALDEDPLRAANEARQLERERKETQRKNAILAQQGRNQLPVPSMTAQGMTDIPPNESRDYYVYEVKLINTGTKKIRSLVWAYVLFNEATQQEVGNHAFASKVGLGAGKSKGLIGMSTTPPASVVDVSKSAKETAPGQYTERVEIQRVEYEDGTVWERGRQ
jgi:hypothetical protein